jgi:hypothetical protein
MTLNVVSFNAGSGTLGRWGTLRLTGAQSAVIQSMVGEDIELPAEVAADLPGPVLLDEACGRLLFLPYSGEMVSALDLPTGEEIFEPVVIPRDGDVGMRRCDFRVVPTGGVLYLTEMSLLMFDESFVPLWRVDEDFGAWCFEEVTDRELLLVSGDWTGHEESQVRALASGDRVSVS